MKTTHNLGAEQKATKESKTMKKISAKLFASVSLIITAMAADPPMAAHAASEVTAWGDNGAGQTNVPSG